MAADLLSSFLGMTLQATGNNNNAWGTILNGSALQIMERAIRGNVVHAVTGGTLDLSQNPPPNAVNQVLDFVQIFQGALTVNQIVILPNISGYWKFINETTGAFQLLLQTSGGTFVNIPQGCSRGVTCDGAGSLLRDDRDQVGNFEYNAIVAAGTMEANGQSVLKTDFPDLYSQYGSLFGSVDALHFTLPLLTDTGRFLRARTTALGRGTYQSNQNAAHTHTGSGTTSTESVGHSHSFSGTTAAENAAHNHSGVVVSLNVSPTSTGGGGSPAVGAVSVNLGTSGNENQNHGHDYSGVTGGEGAAHTHTFSLTTSSSGEAEARPEALAVVVSIRY